MAYNELLADRIRNALRTREGVEEKKMFGGLAFMYKGKMACGIVKDDLMVRVVPSKYEVSLQKPHCREMDFTGKPMKGFLYVEPEGFDTDRQLDEWIGLGIEFAESAFPLKRKHS